MAKLIFVSKTQNIVTNKINVLFIYFSSIMTFQKASKIVFLSDWIETE